MKPSGFPDHLVAPRFFCAAILIVALSGLRFVAESAADPNSTQPPLERLLSVAADSDDPQFQLDVLRGMRLGLTRDQPAPENWLATKSRMLSAIAQQSQAELWLEIQRLGVRFGDQEAVAAVLSMAADSEHQQRQLLALEVVATSNIPGAPPVLFDQLDGPAAVAAVAIRALGSHRHPATSEQLLEILPRLQDEARREAFQLLSSRVEHARQLCQAIENGRIQRADVPVFCVRQMSTIKASDVREQVAKIWERESNPTDGRLRAKINNYKQRLSRTSLASADPVAGRQVFREVCANCHKLYGEGKLVGPDLTGAQRYDINYLLSNIIHPSGEVARDFCMTIIETADGRSLNGLVIAETQQSLTLQTETTERVIAKSEIETRELSRLSMMPNGLLDPLQPQQVRDLFGYLMTKQPLPETSEPQP